MSKCGWGQVGVFMINERRVRELFHLSVFDEYEMKKYEQTCAYTMWDYVGKELVKSFFCGTAAFVLLAAFLALADLDRLTEWINHADFMGLLPNVIILYVAFMVVYLLCTAGIYCVRYAKGYRRMKAYGNHLKRARRLLREEKQ